MRRNQSRRAATSPQVTLTGTITRHERAAVSAQRVTAYVRTPIGDVLIGEGFVDERGGYSVRVRVDRSGADGPRSDVFVRVRDVSGTVLAKKGPIAIHAPRTTVDFALAPPGDAAPPELTRALSTIAAHVDGTALADLTGADAARLAKKAGEPVGRVRAVARAARLSRALTLPIEAAYAMVQAGLPAEPANLAAEAPATLRRALEGAARDRLVPAFEHGQVDAVLDRVARTRADYTPIRNLLRGSQKLWPAITRLLRDRRIATLADLRRNGGVAGLGAAVRSGATLEQIDAHAGLSVLTADPVLRNRLIDAGLRSVSAIARLDRGAFVRRLRGGLDAEAAGAFHDAARAQYMVARNAVTTIRAAASSGNFSNLESPLRDYPDYTRLVPPVKCGCEDCEAAVSPLTYLADLLAYVKDNVRATDRPNLRIDWRFLQEQFLQPFGRLPLACDAVDAIVRTTRICIEVLRQTLAAAPPTPARRAALADAERAYVQSLYEALLVWIGTSADELRIAQTDTDDARRALADRIGLPAPTANVDRLQDLLLDIIGTAVPALEAQIEDLFGFRDTRADPLRAPRPIKLAQWRRARLRELWRDQDWPAGMPADGRPVIDPDVIGPDDFRSPDTADAAFRVWRKRRNWIDQELAALAGLGFDQMLDRMYVSHSYPVTTTSSITARWPAPKTDLAALYQSLGSSALDAATAAQLRDRLFGDYGLTVDELNRLMELKQKDAASVDPRNPRLDDAEWTEAIAILVQALKQLFYARWLTEESDKNIEFGADEFWIALREPAEGDWPPTQAAGAPLIDPELLTAADLPDSAIGDPARALYDARRTRLQQMIDQLRTARESPARGLPEVLRVAFGNPLPVDLDQVLTDLSSADPNVSGQAETTVRTQLHLTPDDFRFVMAVRSKDADADPLRKPMSGEYDQLYRSLASGEKVRLRYPEWIAEEQQANLTYWQALKARLPKWRSSPDARADWRRALRVRTGPPLIDPDQIGRDHLAPPSGPTPNPALTLWTTRAAALQQNAAAVRALREGSASARAGLDAVLDEALGIDRMGLLAIDDLVQQGQAIAGRLDQLGLSNAAFDQLVRVAKLLAGNQAVYATEWQAVYDILTQTWKLRNRVAWRDEEQQNGLLLSPDYFRVPIPDPAVFPPPPRPALPAWRADIDALLTWEDTLQSRINLDASVDDALAQIRAAAEEAVLPPLRDALIAAARVPGAGAPDRAQWLADRLLIDMKCGGCATTTRVAQAIETVQALVFLLRAGQLRQRSGLDTLALTDTALETFDDDWSWMGSYSTWRAAIFVLLYPENILLPTLRADQTAAFREFARALRAVSPVTPLQAAAAVAAYGDYFLAVCALEQPWAITATIGPSASGTVYQILVARSAAADAVYWCTRTPTGGPASQSSWLRIDGLETVTRIAGVVEYDITTETRYLLLFAETGELGQRKFVVSQFDLKKGAWADGEPTELEWPDGKGYPTSITLISTNAAPPYRQPPAVYVTFADGSDATRRLADNGKGWEKNDFTPVNYTEELSKWEDGSRQNEGLDNDSIFNNPDWNRILKWMAAGNTHAKNAGYVAGFPNFYQDGDRFGVVMATALIADVLPISAFYNQSRLAFDSQGPTAFFANSHTLGAVRAGYKSGFPIVEEQNGTWYWVAVALIKDTPNVIAWSDIFQNVTNGIANRPERSATANNFEASDIATRFTWANDAAKQWGADYLGFPTFTETQTSPFTDNTCYFAQTRHVTIPIGAPIASEAVAAPYKPDYDGAYRGSAATVGADIQALRRTIASAYATNATLPPSIRRYLDEAWYFVPVHAGLQLQQAGSYRDALDWFRNVYDYTAPIDQRKIAYLLVAEEALPADYQREANWSWLRDPLNPHRIAVTRANTYTRFSLLTIARCLLDDADDNFTRDTSESIPLARLLYEAALRLLSDPAIAQKFDGVCDDLIGTLEIEFGDAYLEAADLVGRDWGKSLSVDSVARLVPQLQKILDSRASAAVKAARFKQTVSAMVEQDADSRPSTLSALLDRQQRLTDQAADAVGMLPQYFAGGSSSSHQSFRWMPAAIVTACIPPNPILRALRLRADANLYKIRTCRNIAGLNREIEAYAAPTDTSTGMPSIGPGGALVVPGLDTPRPTPYRYTTLIERARQMVQLAQQVEVSMLSALQQRDSEAYNLLRARQDVEHAQATVTLQDLRLRAAQDDVDLAELQRDRADLQVKTYEEWINGGLLDQEQAMIAGYYVIAASQMLAVSNGALLTQLSTPAAAVPYLNYLIGGAIWTKAAAESQAALAQAITNHMAVLASFERKRQEWQLSRDVARQDVAIGNQQIRIAQDQVRMTTQEGVIARLDADHAQRTVDFLSTKFTNVEL